MIRRSQPRGMRGWTLESDSSHGGDELPVRAAEAAAVRKHEGNGVMDALGINVVAGSGPGTVAAPAGPSSFSGLGSEEFLKLLITQLTTQDPLAPTGNEELLRQIASIREIELSTMLTKSLSTLGGQQRFASASALIGHYVTSVPDAGGSITSGVVVGVRFETDGSPLLLLANGSELSLESVSTIEPQRRAGEALMGRSVVGIDGRDASAARLIEGIVTGVRVDEEGEVILELDSGDELRMRDYATSVAEGI